MTLTSLNTILSQYGSTLLIDASSTVVHAAWLRSHREPLWQQVADDAGRGIFQLVKAFGRECTEADAFIFCEGPGSILGIRTAATAIRTWQALRERPAFAYRSLELLAHLHAQPGDHVICDARRQSWHHVTLNADGATSSITRIPTPELPTGRLIMPDHFRIWSQPPVPTPTRVSYDPTKLSTTLADAPLMRPCPEPDAFLHEDPSYATWTPSVHRAPEVNP